MRLLAHRTTRRTWLHGPRAVVVSTGVAAVCVGAIVAGLVMSSGTTSRPVKDPRLTVAKTDLSAAVQCHAGVGTAKAEPLLLVHGTAMTAAQTWSWNYAPALSQAGFTVCEVNLPDRGLTDIQLSAQYVAYAIEQVAARTHERVAVITHSQGGLDARWALRWWPETDGAVADLIMLASPNHGVTTIASCVQSGECWPALWQMVPGSAFLRALNRDDGLPSAIAVTNIFSRSDDVVQPVSTVPLTGGNVTNVAVQDLCPGDVGHVALLADGVAYALVRDALAHAGPARPSRIPADVCASPYLPGLTASTAAAHVAAVYQEAAAALSAFPKTAAEPPLASYTRRAAVR